MRGPQRPPGPCRAGMGWRVSPAAAEGQAGTSTTPRLGGQDVPWGLRPKAGRDAARPQAARWLRRGPDPQLSHRTLFPPFHH